MKFVSVFIAISYFVVGLQSLPESGPDQNQEVASESIYSEIQKEPTVEADRSGHSFVVPSFVVTKPKSRPSSGPLNVVQCYTCMDCPKVLSNTTTKICPYTLDPTKQGKCMAYAEQYSHMKSPLYIRGCASERGSCTDIRKAYSTTDAVKLLNCQECEGDRCNSNSASLSLIDFTMAFFAMVVSPLVAKYTLS